VARHSILHQFYCSDLWIKFRLIIIQQRGMKCEHCGEMIRNAKDFTLHHKIELTIDNIHDANITLNPNNVLIVHHDSLHNCHNKIHNRFGYHSKAVYIVYGPPLSGKTSLVADRMTRGDLVVDMDLLYQSLSMCNMYDKPNNLLSNVNAVHNMLIDNIKTRYGRWNNAWIIGGYADKYKREKLCNDLDAELIFCETSKEECMVRLAADIDRLTIKDEWTTYINKWFDTFTV